MKNLFYIFLIFIFTTNIYSQDNYLQEANKLYKQGKQDKAKELYEKAAKQGSADAHFYLAYRYVVNKKEAIYHFSQAAKQGNEKALENALEYLAFRAADLKLANPKRALNLYYEAKKANPNIKLYDEKSIIKILKMASEAKEFDADKFIKKYNIDLSNKTDIYFVWELAEEAAKDGRFGKPNPDLVFNLVIRGGEVPAEYESAVEDTYKNWKKGIAKFDICNHITSGMGGTYCGARLSKKKDKQRAIEIKEAKTNLSKNTKKLLDVAYEKATKFIEDKASTEELHGGSGRGEWIISSQDKQKKNYLALIKKIKKGFKPKLTTPLNKYDKELNIKYKKAMAILKKKRNNGFIPFNTKEFRTVQRLWIKYRDASTKLFVKLNPKVKKEIWDAWLTKLRNKDLDVLIGNLKYY